MKIQTAQKIANAGVAAALLATLIWGEDVFSDWLADRRDRRNGNR